MTVEIWVTGKYATRPIVIDEEDAELVSKYRWYIVQRKGSLTLYACGHLIGGDFKKSVYMHRVILGNPNAVVDHIDGDGLNNRRSNLRATTQSVNIQAAWDREGCFGDAGERVRERKKYLLARGRGENVERVDEPRLNRVKARLADGTVKYYIYDRDTKERIGVETIS